MANNKEKIHERIKELIFKLGKNNSSFASSIGYSSTAINKTVAGDSNPAFKMIERILTIYPSVNKDWLVSGNGTMFNENLEDPALEQPENSYLMEAVMKIEQGFRDVVNEQKEIIRNQRFIIDTLQSQLSKVGNFNIPAVSARVVEMYPETNFFGNILATSVAGCYE